MATEIQICNFALSQIGQDVISDFDEASPQARACKLFYAQGRDAVLSEIWWNFATAEQVLAQTATDPSEWDYAYALPSDCLIPRYIPPVLPGQKEPFAWAGREIWTHREEATLVYTRQVTDPAFFHPLFIDALALKLATLISMPLAIERSMRSDAVQLYRGAIALARQTDANASDPFDASKVDSPFIGARA